MGAARRRRSARPPSSSFPRGGRTIGNGDRPADEENRTPSPRDYVYEDGDKVKHVGANMPVSAKDIKITAVEVDHVSNKPLELVE